MRYIENTQNGYNSNHSAKTNFGNQQQFMEQKVILTTGVASGFGRATAGTLAGRIAKIIELRHPADNYVIASFLQRLSVFASGCCLPESSPACYPPTTDFDRENPTGSQVRHQKMS